MNRPIFFNIVRFYLRTNIRLNVRVLILDKWGCGKGTKIDAKPTRLTGR